MKKQHETKEVRVSYTELKRAILELRQRTQKHQEYYRGHYRSSRSWVTEYFTGFPKWRNQVIAYVSKLRKEKQRIVHVDICGEASAVGIGATISYWFSLAKKPFLDEHDKALSLVNGDLFDSGDFNRFVRDMKRRKEQIAFITFSPDTRLQSYGPTYRPTDRPDQIYHRVVYQKLENDLRKLVTLLRPGGLILIEKAFFAPLPDLIEKWPEGEVAHVKSLFRRLGCSVKAQHSIYGQSWLVEKWNKPKATT